jgi:hypothetical protein
MSILAGTAAAAATVAAATQVAVVAAEFLLCNVGLYILVATMRFERSPETLTPVALSLLRTRLKPDKRHPMWHYTARSAT